MIIDKVFETLQSRRWIADCATDIPNLAMAFDTQDRVTAIIADVKGGFSGFKIAYNSLALMAKMSLPHPMMGRVFADEVYENGVHLDSSKFVNLMIEPEIAAELKSDITADDDLSVATIGEKVSRFFPAFEILDRRGVDGLSHVPTIVAHNVFNAGIVVGGPGISPKDLKTAQLVTECRDNKSPVAVGKGLAPQDPFEALAFLARHFVSRGQILPKGSLLLLGAHCPLYAVGVGRRLTLNMGALGEVHFST